MNGANKEHMTKDNPNVWHIIAILAICIVISAILIGTYTIRGSNADDMLRHIGSIAVGGAIFALIRAFFIGGTRALITDVVIISVSLITFGEAAMLTGSLDNNHHNDIADIIVTSV